MPSFSMQIESDHKELLQKLEDGTSKYCCFDNRDIVTDAFRFDDDGDPAAAARRIFVRSIL